jgi:hypothetical protein
MSATSGASAIARTNPEDNDMNYIEIHSVCILDASTFDPLHVCEFPQNETVYSLCAAELTVSDVTKNYYIVGTAIFVADDQECKLV